MADFWDLAFGVLGSILEGAKERRKMESRQTIKATEKIMNCFLEEILELSSEDLQKLYKRYKEGKLEYMITYDMGCGNTSAAVISLKGDFAPRLIEWTERVGENTVSVPSVKTILGRDYQGYLIGSDAVSFVGSVENFKDIPDGINLMRPYIVGRRSQGFKTLEEVWTIFFKMTFDRCMGWVHNHPQYGGNKVTKDNTIFVVAHPAGAEWSKELPNYRKLIITATGLPSEQVITFSEAKASMMYARQKRDGRGALILKNHREVLVIDLGASTIDVLYVDARGNPKKEFSITLAGRNIDEMLGHALLEKYYPEELAEYPAYEIPDTAFFGRHKHELDREYSTFRFDMRALKEDICKYPNQTRVVKCGTKTMEADSHYLMELLNSRKFRVVSTMEFAKFMTGQEGIDSFDATWNEALTMLVKYMTEGLSNDCQIVVSGGTANLIGIEDCIREGAAASGVHDPQLTILNQPSDYEYTVPFGSEAYLRRVLNNLDQLEQFPGDMTIKLKNWLCNSAADCITPLVAADAEKKIQGIVVQWAEPKEKASVRDLFDRIEKITYRESEAEKLIQQGLSDMKNQAIRDNQTRADQIRGKVESTCTELLNNVAPTGNFDSRLNFAGLHLDIKASSIQYSVQKSLKEIDWLEFQYWWGMHGTYDPLPRYHRSRIARKWNTAESRETIRKQIHKDVLDAVEKQYDATNGFGIMAVIMDELRSELGLALFQQA